MRRAIVCIIVLSVLLFEVQSDAVLNNAAVTFQMQGTTTFTPDAGGSAQTGYKLTLGYTGNSWIGVQLVNSGYNSDILIVKLSDFYANTGNPLFDGHQISIEDYHRDSSGGDLIKDTITTYDISANGYSKTKKYSITLTRYLGSNNNEDWDASTGRYSVQQVCFYTSSQTFNASTFNQQTPTCVNYEINNLVSNFVGFHLKDFSFNGYNTKIYGYIDGPNLASKLYFYQATQLFGYVQVPAIAIEIGATSGGHGQDFYAYSPISSENGDYYGNSVNQLTLDNFGNGFQNPALTMETWNADPLDQISGLSLTALRIHFSRAVYTYDPYDKSMLSTFIFCMYLYSSGSISGSLSDKSCEIVELSKSYVQLGGSTSWQPSISLFIGVVALLMMLTMI